MWEIRSDSGRAGAVGVWLYRAAIGGLLLLALGLAAYPAARVFANVEVSYNEGWNAFVQARAAAGQTLYSGTPLFFCNYPPLSFYLIGALGQPLGDVVLAGRLVSLIGLGTIALAAALAVRRAGGGWLDGGLAAAGCLLAFLVFHDDYVGANDPQFLAMAFSVSALAIYLGGRHGQGQTAMVAALLALSLLTKHNIVVLPAVIALDIALRRDRRELAVFFATGLTIGGLAGGYVLLTEGTALFEQLLAPRTWSAERAWQMTAEFLSRYGIAALAVAAGLALRRDRAGWLVLIYLVLAVAIGILFAGGAGTAANMYFEAVVALAIGAGLALAWLRAVQASVLIVLAAVLVTNLGVLRMVPYAGERAATQLSGGLVRDQVAFAADVAWLKSQKGPALCESMLLCLRAGKSVEVDPFNSYQAIVTGRLPGDVLTRKLLAREYAAVQIRSTAQSGEALYRNFDNDVFAALGSAYVPARRGVNGQFWAAGSVAPNSLE